MKRKAVIVLAAAAAATGPALAQDAGTPAAAFKAGQDFSNGSKGTAAASAGVSAASGRDNVPKFSTTAPPEASLFGGGKSLLGGAGTGKVSDCKDRVAASAYDQQECDAVNYLNKMDRTNRFAIDKKTDPLMTTSGPVVKSPGAVPTRGVSACRIERTTIPGTTTTETCEESTVLATLSCNKNLVPECSYVGTPISAHSETKSGAFVYSTLSAGSSAGLYDYNIEVPYRNCSGEGVGELSFNLDTIGFGSYVTIDLSNLDDAAAIGVNGTTVFAGYPNAGPQYSGGFFPTGAKDFQVGYSWSEDVGTSTCVATDWEGKCTKSAWTPDVRTFYANTKLLDYCPSGYSPVSQSANRYCDPDSGYCTPVDAYSPNNVPGFFCNAEGKFLMNRHEGAGTWGGSVSTAMPLRPGINTVRVYWGTGQNRKDCGNVKVSGQIYNVAPSCPTHWDDQCAAARGALKASVLP